MEQSQDYSFNKAHSACYALIAYRTAWLKANHPHEYMAALISSVMNTKDRVPFYVNACDEMGIEVLPPDVNSSAVRLRRRRGQDPLRPERGQERGRVGGARDHRGARGGRAVRVDLGLHRARRPAGREQARARVARQVRRARLDRRARGKGMLDVLEHGARAGAAARRPTGSPGRARSSTSATSRRRDARRSTIRAIAAGEFEQGRAAAAGEGERSGSTSPSTRCTACRDQLRRKTDCALAEVERRRDGEVVTVGGIVGALKQLTTKKGEPMVFLRARRRHRRRRGRRLQLGLRGRARAAASPTGSSSSRAGSTTSRRARRS